MPNNQLCSNQCHAKLLYWHYRHEIFEIHTRSMQEMGSLSPDVNLKELAANTTRFSGAEIAGLVRAATSYALDRMVSCHCRALKCDNHQLHSKMRYKSLQLEERD